MKAVILAGGLGSRLSEETVLVPKPMVQVGGRPILWHIMNILAAHDVSEFVVALGYKGEVIKRFFHEYHAFSGDMTVSLRTGETTYQNREVEDWTVHLVETGPETMTGGRVKRLEKKLAGRRFMVTYGDGVADVDIGALRAFHESKGVLATVTAVQPPGRWGALDVHGDLVTHYREKPRGDGAWTNGGFFLLEPEVAGYIEGDTTTFEEEPLRALAHEGKLASFRHEGHWQVMDTLRDKHDLEAAWASGERPWVTWEP